MQLSVISLRTTSHTLQELDPTRPILKGIYVDFNSNHNLLRSPVHISTGRVGYLQLQGLSLHITSDRLVSRTHTRDQMSNTLTNLPIDVRDIDLTNVDYLTLHFDALDSAHHVVPLDSNCIVPFSTLKELYPDPTIHTETVIKSLITQDARTPSVRLLHPLPLRYCDTPHQIVYLKDLGPRYIDLSHLQVQCGPNTTIGEYRSYMVSDHGDPIDIPGDIHSVSLPTSDGSISHVRVRRLLDDPDSKNTVIQLEVPISHDMNYRYSTMHITIDRSTSEITVLAMDCRVYPEYLIFNTKITPQSTTRTVTLNNPIHLRRDPNYQSPLNTQDPMQLYTSLSYADEQDQLRLNQLVRTLVPLRENNPYLLAIILEYLHTHRPEWSRSYPMTYQQLYQPEETQQ